MAVEVSEVALPPSRNELTFTGTISAISQGCGISRNTDAGVGMKVEDWKASQKGRHVKRWRMSVRPVA